MRYLQLIIYLGFTAIVQGQGVHDDPYDIKFLLKRLEVEDSTILDVNCFKLFMWAKFFELCQAVSSLGL